MAAQNLSQVFDQSQIADTINRQKLGSQRQRNEMMRLGTSDPGAFALQNKPTIQQAAQPSEFWGAGRKELPPDIDTSLVGAMGGSTAKLGGQDFYYSNYDMNKASWGTQDADDIDLGKGQYNIMSNGKSLGTGYKSLADTIKEYQTPLYKPQAATQWQAATLPDAAYTTVPNSFTRTPNNDWLTANNYRAATPKTDNFGMPILDDMGNAAPTTYEQLINGFSAGGIGFYGDEASAATAQKALSQQHITGNELRNWETLGQLLNYGSVNGNWSDSKSLGGNNLADPVSGLNTLYGSKPIIYDGQLLGYNQQGTVDPIINQWDILNTSKSGNGWTSAKKETNEWDNGYAAMGRQYQNPNWWSSNTIKDNSGSGRYTITPENAANSPGWTNNDAFARNQGSETHKTGAAYYTPGAIGNALFGKSFHEDVGRIIDPILGYVLQMPTFGGSTRVGRATDAIGNGGSFGDSYDAATADGWTGAARSLGTALVSDAFSGAGEFLGASTTPLIEGSTTSYASMIDGALASAAGSAINGGGVEGTLRGAAGGALGGLAGGFAAGATDSLGQVISKMAGGAASGGINSLFNKNSPIAGSLYGAMSGGLHGFLNSTASGTNTLDKKTDAKNQQTARNITGLAKAIADRTKNGSSKANR